MIREPGVFPVIMFAREALLAGAVAWNTDSPLLPATIFTCPLMLIVPDTVTVPSMVMISGLLISELPAIVTVSILCMDVQVTGCEIVPVTTSVRS